MNKHYITVDGNSLVTKAFSDAFEQPLDTDICVNENGGRHYNLNLTREDGLPKYKYIDGVFTETTEDDFIEELSNAKKIDRQLKIIQELKSLDYKTIKRVQGKYTEDEWNLHIAYCDSLRDEYNELEVA